MRRVERAGGVVFQAYGQRGGKKVYVGTFSTEREAKAAERKHAVTQEMIAAGELAPETDTRRTFGEAADEWLASLKASKGRSHLTYSNRLRQYIYKHVAPETPLSRINRAVVGQLRDELSKKVAANTVNGSLIALSSAFSYFVEREWTDTNPVHGIRYASVTDRQYEWIKTREEITRLIAETTRRVRPIVIIALGTGMRLDEILHLRWPDIDIERRLIAVHRGRQGTTKSGKLRHVPILNSLLPHLRELALKRGGAIMLFPAQKQRHKSWSPYAARSKQGVTLRFREAVARAGLPKTLRFHDLRHTFASHWMMSGGCIFRLSKILGHSNVAITQKVYAHLSPDAWEQDYDRVSFVVPAERPALAMGDGAETAKIARRKSAG